MPNPQMPDHLTKVSYILRKTEKPKLERAAKKAGMSMSDVISNALREAGILHQRKRQSVIVGR